MVKTVKMKTKHMLLVVVGFVALSTLGFMHWSRGQGLVIHEWGTFTSLQGSDGVPLKWNPLSSSHLPGFVYSWRRAGGGRLPTGLLALGPKSSLLTLQRLETPVIYFYSDRQQTVDLSVHFPKGGITEWYPQASAIGPSIIQPGQAITKLDSGLHALDASPAFTLASLDVGRNVNESLIEWQRLKVLPVGGADKSTDLPKDNSGSHYFTARNTDSAYVQVPSLGQPKRGSELEKFLFYRGVGDFATPLNVSMESGDRVSLLNAGTHPISHLFILSIKGKSGSLIALDDLKPGQHTEAVLASVQQLRPLDELLVKIGGSMEHALIAEGLFDREAIAMVNTWKDSWFSEEGDRVLYLLPRAWTDEVLPMIVTPAPKDLVRVMVGRAELITPETEKQLAAGIASAKQNRQKAVKELRPLAAQLGRFAEPAWDHALSLAELPLEDQAQLHGLLRAPSAN